MRAAGIFVRGAAALGLLAATSCVFETRYEDPSRPGYVNLELSLKPNADALLKRASTDTLFSLDSLIITLSTSGEPTVTYAYPISGRSDTGNISVTSKIYPLAPLRTWKARILTIDTSAARRDTVHLDSVTFTINGGDTTVVAKTVNPVYSILKGRLVSNSPASLTNNVKYLRIRVDGTTRDSAFIGPALRAASYGNSNTGYLVGDSGTLYRTTNGGANWTAVTSGVTRNLNGVSFTGTNNGYAVGDGGSAIKTTTGTAWTVQSSGTTRDLNAVYFSGANVGYAVGDSGTIRISNGTTWSGPASTATNNQLNGVYFSSNSTGYAVGAGGVIVKTTNNGAAWTALTSGTTRNLNAVFFPSAGTGYAVGDSGTILKTTNNGTSWAALTSGTTQKLRCVYFNGNTAGWAAGDNGTLVQTTNGTAWNALTSGTTQNVNGLIFSTNNSAGLLAGNLGAASTSGSTGTTWNLQWLGTKSFDVLLTYKYFKPNVAHTLLMEAIDTLSGALRGYQVSKTITLSPGKDTTITPTGGLAKCGYSGFPACTL